MLACLFLRHLNIKSNKKSIYLEISYLTLMFVAVDQKGIFHENVVAPLLETLLT